MEMELTGYTGMVAVYQANLIFGVWKTQFQEYGNCTNPSNPEH